MVIALPHPAHACNKLRSWQSIRHCFTLAFDHKQCEHRPKLCTWLILEKPCSLKMCHRIHILCELCGNELVFLRGRALLFTQACDKIAWKSFTALSKIPFFTYPAIMAVHGTTFLSGIFWNRSIASSKYPFWAYPVNILSWNQISFSHFVKHFACNFYKTTFWHTCLPKHFPEINWIVLHFLLF